MERAFMLAQLVSCPYCLSHWVAAAFVIPLGLNPLSDAGWFVGYSVSIFAVVGMSALITGAVLRLLLMQESEIRALEGALNDAKKTIKDFLS